MTYEEAKEQKARLELIVARASAKLKEFPRTGPMGLIPDDVKFSPAYRAAKAIFDTVFSVQRNFNATFTKTFAKEIRAERRARIDPAYAEGRAVMTSTSTMTERGGDA